jgi:hypothetical protein
LQRDDDCDLQERLAHNERMLEANAWREAVRRTAPADLAALGVDRADLRMAAAQAYLRSVRAAALVRIDLGLRRIILLDRILATWRRRGEPGFGPDESDFADAALWYERKLGECAPDLAYIPPPHAGKTSEAELLRLGQDQRRFEAARKAWRRQLLARRREMLAA